MTASSAKTSSTIAKLRSCFRIGVGLVGIVTFLAFQVSSLTVWMVFLLQEPISGVPLYNYVPFQPYMFQADPKVSRAGSGG